MLNYPHSLLEWIYKNWFIPIASLIVFFACLFIKTTSWEDPPMIENITLFNFSILIPFLYLLCYRSGLRRTFIRMSALSLLGVWGASFIIPDEFQLILIQLKPLRYMGIAILFLIEIRLLIMMLQFIISADETEEDLSQHLAKTGDLPEWYSKLMALEANFWR